MNIAIAKPKTMIYELASQDCVAEEISQKTLLTATCKPLGSTTTEMSKMKDSSAWFIFSYTGSLVRLICTRAESTIMFRRIPTQILACFTLAGRQNKQREHESIIINQCFDQTMSQIRAQILTTTTC